MGTAKVYLNPGLPVVIQEAHRVVYLSDGSQHVLDKHDRPLFSAPPGTGVVIVMEYSLNEDPEPKQVAPFVPMLDKARPAPIPPKVAPSPRPENVAEQTQPMYQVPDAVSIKREDLREAASSAQRPAPVYHVDPVDSRSTFPHSVPTIHPPVRPAPGEIHVQRLADRAGDITGEMSRPDFQSAPSSTSRGTGRISERGAAAS